MGAAGVADNPNQPQFYIITYCALFVYLIYTSVVFNKDLTVWLYNSKHFYFTAKASLVFYTKGKKIDRISNYIRFKM